MWNAPSYVPYGQNLPIYLGISWFSVYPPSLPNQIKISRIFQKTKEKLIGIPQYLIIFCNNFLEETEVKWGDSHCMIFFTFKWWRHSPTQAVASYLTRKYFVLWNIILLYVPLFIFWIHLKQQTNKITKETCASFWRLPLKYFSLFIYNNCITLRLAWLV